MEEKGPKARKRSASWSRLLNAAKRGDLDALEGALEDGADPNERDEIGRAAGVWAAKRGFEAALGALAKAGWRLDHEDSDGESAVSAAVAANQVGSLRELLRLGASPSAAGLEMAALMGRAECLELLLDAGGDPNAGYKGGYTAGHVAAEYGRKEVLERLLERGFDWRARSEEGETAEDVAKSSSEIECEELLRGRRLAAAERGRLESEIAKGWGRGKKAGL